ncbi:alpha/beta hydrolase [Tetragenococcus osmophilus]|uniref:Alpha/beta hydrolase n=1 Tax=Tetragenococcus osmophilus TaxID=526944 RepID=A0AA37XN96_9ENTE|nr:alpha/beta hydrolase [Tetragenococcus osmophilus]GMA52668.1 alpha/beta hydrolase [Alicyclobacillus contaminans]AYW47168.1 alpha/beta hydrolase [Tetragenococcus osmophilus]GMA55257.1 alpha/beta hydrolase [Alicyclobacillus contaminans]GMA55314.1 alpha/beta hydrolase [Alicyclobacillus contaminans]GMA70978.1 alpha/beta hydrolase [Tetragenococcus osmophilus]
MNEQKFTFPIREVMTTGILRLPEDSKGPFPTIVVMHPISSVKEQTSSLYAERLTDAGFATFVFDASHQGELHEAPEYIEIPYYRVNDVKWAIDFLNTLEDVDNERIGIAGICGGGGYAVNAALTEKRIKAVASLTGANYGMLTREGDMSPGSALDTLHMVAKQRQAEATGAETAFTQYSPNSHAERKQAGVEDIDSIQAVDYYEEHAPHPNRANKYHVTDIGEVAAWDATYLADELLDQPLIIFAGDIPGTFGAYRTAYELYDKALTTDKQLKVLPKTTHYDIYDNPETVDKIMEDLVPFFQEKL